MKVEGEHLFHAPREVVYEMFNDPDALGAAVPGMQKMVKLDESHYEAAIGIRVGPVSANFSGNLTLTDEVPPESVTLIIEGKGGAGFVKGVGYVKFEDLGDETTLLRYTGEANIGGTLASVGQRMIDSVAKSMFKTVFDKLDKILEERWQKN
ncbi:MAG: carbon monoxide dehydrogenase subunit G [Anaerolineaceae bacterium]|nr:carbon monoxide dehydrogenase subunit G [Anaerolineaceae bacterium]